MRQPVSARRWSDISLPKLICSIMLLVCVVVVTPGCSKPSVPSLVGVGMAHDLTQIRKGMSPNEVRRIMGGDYQTSMEEGLRGMDGGNYTWVYKEGRVNFGLSGVTSTEIN